MIFAIREGLRENLEARGFPCAVLLGFDRAAFSSRHTVVVERDRTASDDIRAAIGSRDNARRVRSRFVAYRIRVYALSSKAGAHPWEHDTECEQLVDGVIVALLDWANTEGAIVEVTTGRMLSVDELGFADAALYVCYELQVKVGRSVERRTYAGVGEDTATIASVTNTTKAAIENATPVEVS